MSLSSHLLVKSPEGQNYVVAVNWAFDCVCHVKDRLSRNHQLDMNNRDLYADGMPLDDKCPLNSLSLHSESILYIGLAKEAPTTPARQTDTAPLVIQPRRPSQLMRAKSSVQQTELRVQTAQNGSQSPSSAPSTPKSPFLSPMLRRPSNPFEEVEAALSHHRRESSTISTERMLSIKETDSDAGHSKDLSKDSHDILHKREKSDMSSTYSRVKVLEGEIDASSARRASTDAHTQKELAEVRRKVKELEDQLHMEDERSQKALAEAQHEKAEWEKRLQHARDRLAAHKKHTEKEAEALKSAVSYARKEIGIASASRDAVDAESEADKSRLIHELLQIIDSNGLGDAFRKALAAPAAH